jgi:hypothetical protein
MNSVKIVEEFWERVWKARNPAAIDDFVIEDFVIATGGVDVVSRTKFKEWAASHRQQEATHTIECGRERISPCGDEHPASAGALRCTIGSCRCGCVCAAAIGSGGSCR